MKKLLISIGIMSLYVSTALGQEIERPREVWAFRSVLDQKARILTLALNKNLWVAYDATNCGVFKVWKEGVKFDGAVYTKKHGPQPTSIGGLYTSNLDDEKVWYVSKDGKDVEIEVNFKGYRFVDKGIQINYELVTNDGQVLKVSELPEYKEDGKGKFGLERVFKTKDIPIGYSVELKMKNESMTKLKKDLITNGTHKILKETKINFDWGTTTSTIGLLRLNSNSSTSLTVYYNPNVLK